MRRLRAACSSCALVIACPLLAVACDRIDRTLSTGPPDADDIGIGFRGEAPCDRSQSVGRLAALIGEARCFRDVGEGGGRNGDSCSLGLSARTLDTRLYEPVPDWGVAGRDCWDFTTGLVAEKS